MKRVFENKNAMDTEKELFSYAGFYKTEDDEYHTKYMRIHPDKTRPFPERVELSDQYIEYESEITFYHMSENVKCVGMFDKKIIDLIAKRMNELGYK